MRKIFEKTSYVALSLLAPLLLFAEVDFDVQELPNHEEPIQEQTEFKFSARQYSDQEPLYPYLDPINHQIAFAEDEQPSAPVLAVEGSNSGFITIDEAYQKYRARLASLEKDSSDQIAIADSSSSGKRTDDEDDEDVYPVNEKSIETSPSPQMIEITSLSEPFLIGVRPVTQKEYKDYVVATKARAPSTWANGEIPSGKENTPVTGITYEDALKYALWKKARLPSEKELAAAFQSGKVRVDDSGMKEWTSSTNGANKRIVMGPGREASIVQKGTAPDSVGFRLIRD